MTQFILITTTVGSREQAEQLAMLITRNRLAACVQRSGPITSTYWWQGKLQTAEEWQLVFKTIRSFYERVEILLKMHHPYKLPEILAIPVLDGNNAYLEWIADEIKLVP